MILVLCAVLTMNLTRRTRGFKISPMDILVFIVIIVFPNLPSLHMLDVHIGVTMAKVLIFFFCYDVLVGELRGETDTLSVISIYVLAVMAIRGFLH